ncbi:MAG: serine hydrolase domain-containing protein [Candidatus Rokuibacteriota bacterium]
MTRRLEALLDEGVATGVFPCARAVVWHRGAPVLEGGAGGATARTIFDLASVTKVMCTTAAFLSLWAEGKVEPDASVSRYVPDAAAGRARITVDDLLYHRSGLPTFVPFFAPVMREGPRLFDRDCPAALRAAARRVVVERVLATAPTEPPRTGAAYSDVGFLLLGELLSVAAGAPLDALFTERVAGPLGLSARFRRLSTTPARDSDLARIAATGSIRPREPAPGQEGLWAPLGTHASPPGEVDDDNAWVMDGVAGHAGLFGTASDVALFGQAVLEEAAGAGRIAPSRLWEHALRRDVATPGSTRALGFDTILPGDPRGTSAGSHIGEAPPGAVGHVGFTGVSLWIDRARHLVVAFCTNRTAAGRAETRIREFRPRFHDAVLENLDL